jgi:hypothetical protein
MYVTTNLSDFGAREIELASELLNELTNRNTTELFDKYFTNKGTQLFFNTQSGYVFLSDEDYNVGMINPENGMLDLYITTYYSGAEGFINELMSEFDDLHPEDQKQILELKGELTK